MIEMYFFYQEIKKGKSLHIAHKYSVKEELKFPWKNLVGYWFKTLFFIYPNRLFSFFSSTANLDSMTATKSSSTWSTGMWVSDKHWNRIKAAREALPVFATCPVFNRRLSHVTSTGLPERHIWAEDAGPPRRHCLLRDVRSKTCSLAQHLRRVQKVHWELAHLKGQTYGSCWKEEIMMMMSTVMIGEKC